MARKRKTEPADFDTFDPAFKPLYPYGEKGKLVSAERLLQVRVVNEALDGKREAINVLFRYAKARQEALDEPEDLDCVEDGPSPSPSRSRHRRAITAMLLLSAASEAVGSSTVMLEPWLTDLALNRSGAPLLSTLAVRRLRSLTRNADTPAPDVFRLPATATPRRRSPEETRFKKGKSGNPWGRPKKRELDVRQSDYLEEIGTVRDNGKNVRMTRLEFVLRAINTKAIKGETRQGAFLAGKYLQVRLQRQKLKAANDAALSENDAWHERCAEADDLELLLHKLRITNRRTVTWILLEPWVVEAALAQFGERRLTLAEQAAVLRATSRPGSVAWPEWWEIRNRVAAKPHLPAKRRYRSRSSSRSKQPRNYDWTDAVDLGG